MSTASDRPHDRREFIGQLASSAVVLTAAAGCAQAASASPVGAVPAGAAQGQSRSQWDDSWFGRLTADHRAVFDSPAIDEGVVFAHVTRYQDAMKEVHGANAQAVAVIRHAAIPLAFNDAMWAKYDLARLVKFESRPGEFPTKNPFTRELADATARGVILLGCDMAARAYAGRMATAAQADRAAVYADLKTNLVPGMILQPNGIYAVHRAQEARCTFIRSSV